MTTPVLAVDHVSVTLGGTRVLDDVSCHVHPGEVVAVLGSNGSGKSTLVRASLGLVDPAAGAVRLFGEPVRDFRGWSRVGYVPQRATVGVRRATVADVVATGRLAHRRPFTPRRRSDTVAVDTALEQVRLADRRHDELATLSGGQQQRVLIARALAAEPELLILDEPTAGVDLHAQQVLAAVLADLIGHGRAMLVVLHEVGPLGALVDRTIVLEHGRVTHDGPPPHRHDAHDHHRDDAESALAHRLIMADDRDGGS